MGLAGRLPVGCMSLAALWEYRPLLAEALLHGFHPCGMKFPQAGAASLHRCPFTGNLPQHLTSCSNLKGLNLSRIMCILVVLLWLESHPHGKLRDYDFLLGIRRL